MLYALVAVVVAAAVVIAFFALSPKRAEPAAAPSPRKPPEKSPSEPPPPPSVGPRIETRAPRPLDEPDQDTQPNPWVLVTAVGRTDPGMKRKNNEDALLVLEDHDLFVVADGMGRHAAGEVASRLAVDTVAAAFASGDFGTRPAPSNTPREAARLDAVFHLANAEVFSKSQEIDTYRGMGTTMVALHFSRGKERAAIAHAGDSRCYRLRAGALEQLTVDHTLGSMGIKGPSASVLSRAVGIEENLEPDVQTTAPAADDVYLICSDGLSRMVTPEQITSILTDQEDLDAAVARLIEVANQAGGKDNVTVILVRVERAPYLAGP